MIWLNFLHFYQPSNQQEDILASVAAQCYRPVFERINKTPNVTLTINITGALLELFDRYGYKDLIEDIKQAVADKKIELTGSCKYHALLPLIPEEEAIRQIRQNEETLRKYFGDNLKLSGFFPPEMAYDPKLSPMLEKLGYKWVIIDEIAHPGGFIDGVSDKIFVSKGSKLKIFFRVRRVSNLIMSAVVRNKESFKKSIRNELSSEGYLVTGMDGETFGHHRVGFENYLFEMLEATEISQSTITNYLDSPEGIGQIEEVLPLSCTWASSLQDIDKGIQFISWKDSGNEIHRHQWELLEMALDLVNRHKPDSKELRFLEVRKKMDMALASDHFFWASGKPWWGLEMIEDGAYRLLDVVRSTPGVTEQEKIRAASLYEKIVSTSFTWQRSGKIRKMAIEQNEFMRIPFKDRTVGKGGTEEAVYQAFFDMMKEQELAAVRSGEYEKAVLWRDALYKLDKKLDIYDTINAVDLLRIDIGNSEVERIIEKYKQDYLKIRGGQPEQRG
jgi:hypothetical protein